MQSISGYRNGYRKAHAYSLIVLLNAAITKPFNADAR